MMDNESPACIFEVNEMKNFLGVALYGILVLKIKYPIASGVYPSLQRYNATVSPPLNSSLILTPSDKDLPLTVQLFIIFFFVEL